MKRWLGSVAALGLLATACQFQPLEDPGLGDRGLTSVVYAADGSVLAEWHAEEDRALVTYDGLPSQGSHSFGGDQLPDAQANDDDTGWCNDRTEPTPEQSAFNLGVPGTPGEENRPCV